jgi:hypothetical protein
MGDLANGYACDAFIRAFADDIVKKFRSGFLDRSFGDKVRYYVVADANSWSVDLYAAIETGMIVGGNAEEEHFRVESAPAFYPTSDSIEWEAAKALGITEEDAEARLGKAREEIHRETERSWQEETLSR